MSGKPEYDKKNKVGNKQVDTKKKEPIRYEDVEGKIGKESLSAAELAIYLSGCRSLSSEFTEKTVKNYIKAICDESDGLLSINDFKHDPSKNGSKYEFKPEYHSLLLTLMDTDYFDGRRNDRKLSTRTELYGQLVNNINRYMSDIDQKVIKKNPVYTNAVLEQHLSKYISNELTALLRTLYHSDPVKRYQLMIEFLNSLLSLRKWMDKVDSEMMSTRMVYAHELNGLKDAIYQQGLFKSVNLDEFIIKFMALRIHSEKYEYISDEEELSPEAMCLAEKLFNITIKDDTDIKKIMDQIKAAISNDKRYNEIMEKAKQILNLEDPLEAQIYSDLKERCKIQYLRPTVSSEEYDRTVRFTEACIADDKWDIIRKFCQVGHHVTEEDMEEIIKIKDHTKE